MKHYLYAMGAILCWASLPAATGSGLSGLSVEELMFFSFTSAALFLTAQDLILNRKLVIHFPGIRGSLLGIWGIFFYHYTYYRALEIAPLAEGAILSTTWSFWIVFFSSILLFKKLKLSIMLWGIVGMGGAALVISSGHQLSFHPAYMKGYLLALACGLIWSSFSVALGRMRLSGDPMTAFTWYAAFLSLLLYLATQPHPKPDLSVIGSAIYLGCIPLGLSFFLWNRALNGGNMVIIGFLSYLTPPLAVLMVALIHRQDVDPQVILGMVLILVASIGGKLVMGRKG